MKLQQMTEKVPQECLRTNMRAQDLPHEQWSSKKINKRRQQYFVAVMGSHTVALLDARKYTDTTVVYWRQSWFLWEVSKLS